MSSFLKLSIFPILFVLITSQLTIQDKKLVENFLNQGQNKASGLFFEKSNSLKGTKEAIYVLQSLGLEVKNKEQICKELSNTKEIDINYISINKFLDCKLSLKNYKPDFNKNKLIELYNIAHEMDETNLKQWSDLFKRVKNFYYQGEGKFSLFKIKEKKEKSLLATALGVEIFCLIATKDPSLKSEIMPFLEKSVPLLMGSYSEISQNMIVYIEKRVGAYLLNSHVIAATKAAKKLGIEISSFNNHLYKLLNYFNTFKYEIISNVDNTYYLVQIYKELEKIPIIKIESDNFNYLKDKNIKIHFENIFGTQIDIKNSTINVKVEENKEKNAKISNQKTKKRSSYELEDDEDETNEKSLALSHKKVEINKPQKEVEINLSDMIKGPGNFLFTFNVKNKQYGLDMILNKNIRSFSEIKIESVDFEIIDKIKDEKNIHLPNLAYPQKLTKMLKATQDNSLIARVKVSFPGSKKSTLIEQVFLRLRNINLDKSYNAYASKFDPETNEYFIGFELDDPVNMESYNGMYEISIVMSDPNIKEVLHWEFGKVEISFTKPSDPQDEINMLKNEMQPKMEPTFAPETKREKNLVIGTVFSMIIGGLTLILLFIVFKSNANINNFPKSSFGFLMNLLFIGVLLITSYILFLFWVKFNILHTMFIFVIMFIPASFIVYKALKNHKIEISTKKEFDLNKF
jgi:hypothetical protein